MVSVSVIIPTYNRAHILQRALKSVFAQTYTNFEIIVVDDGSTDSTRDIIKEFGSKIRYIQHEHNRGVAAARNTGLLAANGKYIAYLDSDDVWIPWKLEKQIAAIEAAPPKIGIVYAPAIILKGDKGQLIPPAKALKCGYVYPDVIRINLVVYLQSSLIRRDCFNHIGLFDERIRLGEDLDILIRITKHFDVINIDEPMCIIYTSGDSITNNTRYRQYANEYIYIMKKHAAELETDKIANARFCAIIGHLLCAEGMMWKGRKYLLDGVKNHPSHVKVALGLLASLFGRNIYLRINKLQDKLQG